jgi:transcriptional regulator with XRE-family HTH domain
VVIVKARISRNLIGPQVRRLRCNKNWSQEALADRLQDMGWNVTRGHIAKIESGEIWVSDIDHFLLSKVFAVDMEDLLPNMKSSESLFIVLTQLTGGHLKMLMSPDEILESKSAKLLNGNKFCPEFGTKSHSENGSLKNDGL